MSSLNTIGQQLLAGLTQAEQYNADRDRRIAHVGKVNVVGAGGSLTAAYEQLRNAAENTEEHLLLQNAVRRFYKQVLITRDEQLVHDSGSELAVELTLAGYIPNDSLTKSQLKQISAIAVDHYTTYEKLLKRRSVHSNQSFSWILDTLGVQVESVINSHAIDAAFIDFAYQYFESIIPRGTVAKGNLKDDYGAALFTAIHKALLKSNIAVIRAALLSRYQISVTDIEQYISFNKRIDGLVKSPLADELSHIVDRQGAPLRIIRRMIEDHPDVVRELPKRDVFLEMFEQQINKEYASISRRINRAIVRSVIFLIITKFLIGIAVEVPYDFYAHGRVIWQPLVINLFFPPLYMIALRLTHTLPGYANTTALVDRADAMLYGERTMLAKRQLSGPSYGAVFSTLYAIFGLVVFGAVTWALLMLGFSFVHITIFFVFISAASFLGFRLSRLIRELEIVRSASNGLTFIRDIIYLPFVVVGQWMSDTYSQVNVVTIILDMLIELPLKTVLRLVRQWSAFIDDRKDRLV